jgi:phytoene desaturase
MLGRDHSKAVVGAGFGGLAATLRLLARGKKVLLLDRQEQAGGKATLLKSGPYRYDAGPTVVTARFLIDELFELFGKRSEDYVDLLPVKPRYRYQFSNGLQLDYDATIEAQIAQHFPSELDNYRRYAAHSEQLFETSFKQYGMRPFDTLGRFAGAVPRLLRLRAMQSAYGCCKRFFDSPELVRAFSVPPLLVGGDPRHTPTIYLLIHHLEKLWGITFPRGGMHALVKGLPQLFLDHGGELQLGVEVAGLKHEAKAAKAIHTRCSQEIPLDLLVYNGDSRFLHQKLLPSKGAGLLTRLRGQFESSMGLLVIYFSTSKTYSDVAHHSILFGPEYEGHLDAVFKYGKLAQKPNIYLHRPGATDPSMSLEGHDSFYALIPVPNLGFGVDWHREGDGYVRHCLDYLEQQALPGLQEHITDLQVRTPHDFQAQQLCTQGAAFTITPRLSQSAYFRYPQKVAHFKNIYCVGAGTHPGGGVPGVLSSAKCLEEVLI